MVYVVCFLISSGLFYLSRNLNGWVKRTLHIIALLIPCVIAGIRADTVGTDVTVYLEQMVRNAKYSHNFEEYMLSSWKQGWVIRGVADIELGFSLLVYSVIKIFGSIYFLQFIIQLLTICPIYWGIKYKNEEKLWIGMLVYYCMFYNNSLNIMRQSIAIAILFLAFQYLFNGKRIKFIIYLLISCLFHNSALLGFPLWLIYEFIQMHIFTKNKIFVSAFSRMVFVVIAAAIFMTAPDILIKIAGFTKMTYYLHYIIGDMSFMPNQIIIRLPVLILCILFAKKLYKMEGNLFVFYTCCVICAMEFSQFVSVNSFAYRIAMIFSVFQIGLIPSIVYVPSKIRLKQLNKPLLNILLTGSMVTYLLMWWAYYCLIKGDSTLPYAIGAFSLTI